MLRANGRDPLFLKATRPDAVYGLVSLMDEAFEAPTKLTNTPGLFLYGGNDQLIPRVPTEMVARQLGPNTTVKNYPRGYHMLLRDLNAEPRWADVADWIAAQNRKHVDMMAAAE
jgi:alpha-beta hydrolase superfamily lysophospholipase